MVLCGDPWWCKSWSFDVWTESEGGAMTSCAHGSVWSALPSACCPVMYNWKWEHAIAMEILCVLGHGRVHMAQQASLMSMGSTEEVLCRTPAVLVQCSPQDISILRACFFRSLFLLLHSQSMPSLDGQVSRKWKREFSDINLRLEKLYWCFDWMVQSFIKVKSRLFVPVMTEAISQTVSKVFLILSWYQGTLFSVYAGANWLVLSWTENQPLQTTVQYDRILEKSVSIDKPDTNGWILIVLQTHPMMGLCVGNCPILENNGDSSICIWLVNTAYTRPISCYSGQLPTQR